MRTINSERDLNRLLLGGLSQWMMLERFEPGTPVGMPDIHWLSGGVSGWIESKYEVDEVRPQQAIWLRRYSRAGGRAHVAAIRRGHLYLIAGRHLPLSRRIPWDDPECIDHGLTHEIDWSAVHSQLIRGT